MNKEELLEYLKENMTIDLYTERTSESYYQSANTKTVVSLYVNNELICSCENTVYD